MAAPVTSTLSSEFARYWRRVTRWIPIESGNYPYVTARVRAKKAALLLPDVYERMLQMEIPQIARILSEGAYKAEILALATKVSGVDLIELATSRNLRRVHADHRVLRGRATTDDRLVPGPVRRAECEDDRPWQGLRRILRGDPGRHRRRGEHAGILPPGPHRSPYPGRGVRQARWDDPCSGLASTWQEAVRGPAVERVGRPRHETVLREPPRRRPRADGGHPAHAGIHPPRDRHRESENPPPALGLEGHLILRRLRRRRPRDPEGGARRDGVVGRERPNGPAPRLRAHGGPFHPAQRPPGPRRGAVGPIGRETPSSGGGSVRPRVSALRPRHPRLHRAEGPRGPEPADHRPGKGERIVLGSHPRTPGDLRWNSPPSAGTNSSRDSSSPGSARPSAWPETSWKRRSRKSWRTRTSGS